MGTLLESLHQLQDVESRLQELRERINRKKRAIDTHRERLAVYDREIAAKREGIKVGQVGSDTLDLEMRSRDQEIARLREHLNKTKTNKEYSALLTQINTTKADNLKIEEKILEKMTALEALRREEAQLQAERAQEKQRVEELQREHDSFCAELADELTSLQQQRDDAASSLPPSALVAFNRVAAKHCGEAMARIDKPDPRRSEYICEGCYMSISAEVVNALMTKDEIRCCQICGRILYLDT
jgi:uncharacterized protein